jgi:branched-chain amino acid transport system ATP-binding protein
MLTVTDLRAGYGKTEIVHGISFTVAAGECVVLIGVNGAGKTTTLKAICGLLRDTSGRIEFEGRRLDGLAGHEIVRRGLVMCPEGRQVFPAMTVLENLELGAYRRSDGDRASDLEEILDMFPVLRERSRQAAGTLSGGEQEMLAIGRALMARPKLCIFDEPSLGLAPKIVEEVGATLKRIKDGGTTILLVEQNAEMALRLADRAYVLEAGEIRLEGTGESLRGNPEVAASYLGF